jgi:hypothetical protein
MLSTPGKSRRNSMTADGSSRCSKTVRIVLASASLMQNIGGACEWAAVPGKPKNVVIRRVVTGVPAMVTVATKEDGMGKGIDITALKPVVTRCIRRHSMNPAGHASAGGSAMPRC